MIWGTCTSSDFPFLIRASVESFFLDAIFLQFAEQYFLFLNCLEFFNIGVLHSLHGLVMMVYLAMYAICKDDMKVHSLCGYIGLSKVYLYHYYPCPVRSRIRSFLSGLSTQNVYLGV